MQSYTNLESLAHLIAETSQYFQQRVQKQVNTGLTLRNWIVGHHIFQYEQHGEDRAQYGEQLFKTLAQRLKNAKVKGLSFTNLYLCRQLYLTYPQILQAASEELQLSGNEVDIIPQTVSGELTRSPGTKGSLLLDKLSFSHFVELIKCEEPLKRLFYETNIIKNQWSVRELQRAMESMLYERTGLSQDKQAILESFKINAQDRKIEDFIRTPYILEFLGLEEKLAFSENDLEEAIINHLQAFLLEMGRGFCFEARQKRITFDNTHYRIDLVFYHRILKCHILIDLKLGEFSHADAGQMNVYLNYYKENEMEVGDSDPIGIILCAGKNETLVRYATAGLPQKVFVSKYLINLPSEHELENIIKEEQAKLASQKN